jgi:nucleotide-binding universal stress UspA family protein
VPKIIVGVDEPERAKDAVALAARLGRHAPAELVLVCAYPYDDHPSRAASGAYRQALREQADATLAAARVAAGDAAVSTHAVADVSPARAIQRFAEQEHAALVVLGSSRRGRIGRVLAGTVAERLLHGAPCPVAVAPRGYAAKADDPLATIVVGYDATPEARAALAAGLQIAAAEGSSLRVVESVEVVMAGMPAMTSGPGYVTHPHEHEQRTKKELEALVHGLGTRVPVEPVAVAGYAEQRLFEQSGDADLMVLGSRGYGPHTAVLLGSVSGRLVRDAECPVLVTPRGIQAPLEQLFPADRVEAV